MMSYIAKLLVNWENKTVMAIEGNAKEDDLIEGDDNAGDHDANNTVDGCGNGGDQSGTGDFAYGNQSKSYATTTGDDHKSTSPTKRSSNGYVNSKKDQKGKISHSKLL